MPNTQAPPHARLKGRPIEVAGSGSGVVAGVIALVFLPPLVAIGIAAAAAVAVSALLLLADLFRRVRTMEADQRTLQERLPEHLAQNEAAIERLQGADDAMVERIGRLERRLVRPDLRELTDLATEQGWEWWRGSDVVRFVSPSGIELTFELPVRDGERRTEIARQLEAFGLKWSSPPTRIEAKNTTANGQHARARG